MALAMLTVVGIGFTSCGDDDSNSSGGNNSFFPKSYVKEFTYTRPMSTQKRTCSYTYDSNNLVTRIDQNLEDSYIKIDYNKDNTVVFQYYSKTDNSPLYKFVVTLNSNGSASSVTLSEGNKSELTYNDNNQLESITSYENGKKTRGYNFEYSDGDLVKATFLYWENEKLTHTEVEANILYVTDTQGMIDNVGGIMNYERLMGISFDSFVLPADLSLIFPTGLFGKPTKHLPLYVIPRPEFNYSHFTNNFTLDSSKRVISASNNYYEYSSSNSFIWEW